MVATCTGFKGISKFPEGQIRGVCDRRASPESTRWVAEASGALVTSAVLRTPAAGARGRSRRMRSCRARSVWGTCVRRAGLRSHAVKTVRLLLQREAHPHREGHVWAGRSFKSHSGLCKGQALGVDAGLPRPRGQVPCAHRPSSSSSMGSKSGSLQQGMSVVCWAVGWVWGERSRRVVRTYPADKPRNLPMTLRTRIFWVVSPLGLRRS